MSNAVYSLRNFFYALFLFPLSLHASFIESTMGTAVVNDATATYHNPAALTLLKEPQTIALGSLATLKTHFSGQSAQSLTGVSQSGDSLNQTHYLLPSAYLGLPLNAKTFAGLAIIYNAFNNELDGNSILRYSQSTSHVTGIDFVPALGIKINQFLSIGGGLNFSNANFLLEPTFGIASTNIPDSQSHNMSRGTSWGVDLGLLLKPTPSTLLGLNYRSANTYHLQGSSVLEGLPPVISNHYHYKFWTPARSVFSINQVVTPKLGLIATVQHIQWSIIKNVDVYGAAAQIGSRRAILSKATVPYYLHNSWLVTVGSHYRATPKTVLRVAATYNQSPERENYQISSGDSLFLGGSIGYEWQKNISIDAGYVHGFFKPANIHILSETRVIQGINYASRDAVSLKLTLRVS
ncbi:MAG: outer membrane protein transport protein [Tatlockia sp.]|jgi:long-subunit fatty acid transport protein